MNEFAHRMIVHIQSHERARDLFKSRSFCIHWHVAINRSIKNVWNERKERKNEKLWCKEMEKSRNVNKADAIFENGTTRNTHLTRRRKMKNRQKKKRDEVETKALEKLHMKALNWLLLWFDFTWIHTQYAAIDKSDLILCVASP